MYKSILVAAVSVIATGAITTSCNSSAENVKEKREEIKDAKHDLKVAKEEYIEDVNNYKKDKAENILENEKIIADLKVKYELEKKNSKNAYGTQIAELEMKNAEMKIKMNSYQPSGQENWIKFKREFSHDMDELGRAFKDLTVNNSK